MKNLKDERANADMKNISSKTNNGNFGANELHTTQIYDCNILIMYSYIRLIYSDSDVHVIFISN